MLTNEKLNHSTAHLLAAAILKLYPDTQLGFGPAIEDGFYYDFKFTKPINDDDLKKIEKEMKKLVSTGWKIEPVKNMTFDNQPYKKEHYETLKKNKVPISYYAFINPSNKKQGFVDLCKGNHLNSVSKIKHFKLLSLAGAYWKGDSQNDQLTRIYGTSWNSKEELDKYLLLLEERKQRDHRKIGKDMNLFYFNNLVGQGFPIWLEDGQHIKLKIKEYIRKTESDFGFREVYTPAFGSKELYKISGHLAHYEDTMFNPMEVDNEVLIPRPMTCPHHIIIYKRKRKSYNDLPIRMSEQSMLYRYEKSGALSGLERVRAMELTEGHIFARMDQIQEEFANAYTLIQKVLKKFDIKIFYVSLSLRDKKNKEKYFDDDKMWNTAEAKLKSVLKNLKIDYKEMIGEAAFYGPKVDIQVKTALNHEITLSTLQLDFLLPHNFDMSFINAKEEKERPIIIHRGLIGTYERFISILLEQTKGVLPFWLSPKQVVIIPVKPDKHLKYAQEIQKKLLSENINVKLDSRNERVGKKIREAQITKTKYQIIIGDEEIENKTINVREYGSASSKTFTIDKFLNSIIIKVI